MSDDQVPYVGPANIYDRYMRGEVLTTTDAVTDESEWVIRMMGTRDCRRLWWMLEHPMTDDTEIFALRREVARLRVWVYFLALLWPLYAVSMVVFR